MTDKFHYQDVFKTINIPKPERHLALKAKNLFDVVYGIDAWSPTVHAHLSRTLDTESASQAFWEFEDDAHHLYDRLALTIMKRGLTIAIEHRDFDNPDASMRKSLLVSRGSSRVYTSDLRTQSVPDSGTSLEREIATFKTDFFETTANLGLSHQIKHLSKSQTNQNESSSASFANAA